MMKFLTPLVKKMVIIMLVLSIIALACYVFLSVKINQKTRELYMNDFKLEQNINKESYLKTVGGSIDETLKEREKTDSYFVGSDRSGVVGFVEELEDLAHITDIDLTTNSIDINSISGNDYLEEMQMSFNFAGYWIDCVHFLNLVENMPYQISFNTVNLNKDLSETKSKIWRGNMMFEVYKFKNVGMGEIVNSSEKEIKQEIKGDKEVR